MIAMMSLIITLAAAIQWIVIRRIPYRIVRILIQVPLLILTFFVAWLVSLGLSGGETAQAAATDIAEILDITTVQRQDLTISISATGALTPARQVPLAFQLPGLPVSEVLVTEGETVAAGDVIARLDVSSFQQTANNAQIALDLQQAAFNALTARPRAADIAAAEAAVEAAQASAGAAVATAPSQFQEEIARLQGEIARNQLWQAQLQRDAIMLPPPLRGVDNIFLPNFVPDAAQEFVDGARDDINSIVQGLNAEASEAARDAFLQAETAVEALEFAVDIADSSYASVLGRNPDTGALAGANAERIQAEIALDRLLNGPNELELARAALDLNLAEIAVEQSDATLAQGELRAPFTGIVAQNNLTPQELPPQGIAILLLDNSSFYVDLPIDETDIVAVRPGQQVRFTVDALPDVDVTGVVTSIAYTPLPIEGLVAYNTRVVVDASTAQLRAGMTVTGAVIVDVREDALVVPNNFIRFDRINGDAFVNVRTAAGTIEERLIQLGLTSDRVSEVIAGLEEDDEIILLTRVEETAGGGLFGG